MVTLTNPDYPHTAVIKRTATTATPPFTATTTEIWSGVVDCQVGGGGATGLKQTVFVSDYTIYCACIESELQTGDTITITMGVGKTPFDCTIKQHTTENIYEDDGVAYGTTIWANLVRQ